MEGVDKISRKFKHHDNPENRTIIRKNIRIELHKHPFMDKTNVLQVASNNKDVPKMCQTQTKTGNKENVNMKKTQIKDRNQSKKLDGALRKELYINVNSLPRNKVANCLKVKEVNTTQTESTKPTETGGKYSTMLLSGTKSSNSIVGIPASTKFLKDPKFNLNCVIRIERFDADKSSTKLTNDVKNTVEEKNSKLTQVNRNANPTSTNNSDKTDCKELNVEHQQVLSILFNEQSKLPANSTIISGENTSRSPKYLRTKVRKNYAEMSMGNSRETALSNPVSTKKVPIYKNQPIEEKKIKAPVDLYEFDEIDNVGAKKNRKRHCNQSEKFDKSMYDILQKIKIKEAKLQAKNKRKAGAVSKRRKCNKPKQEIKKKHPDEINDDFISDHNVEGLFDCAEVVHSTPVRQKPNIKILDNVILNEGDSPDFLDNLQPNAHSTMLPSDKHNPWRFNENLKRNPHFISIKKTALPCLQQDMVLDYDQLEKTEHVTKSSKKTETPKRKLVQKSIMDFMNVSPSSYETNDKENIAQSNLFDYDEFSPKKITPSRDFSKNKIRRNILGAIQDSLENIQANTVSTQSKASRSLAPLIESDENNDVETYFGFGDDNELVLSEKRSKLSEARPYRINRFVHKKPIEDAAEIESLGEGGNFTELQESLDCQAEGDGKEVGLFEDPEQQISLNMPSKIYDRKRRKRRLLSVDLDEEESPKKKKNMMTKKEEAELEKWAAQFNSECEEIEKYKLEIE